ncbi:hypothetical protein BDZ45DRAFT_755927 [Acephala macrosclerotiorum]|nr:hypothetical protein BDZ45DRAFT_755927 [Acephala macrosclerotiorum]
MVGISWTGAEPIAIVGSACRFPGGASSPSKLWELLREPRDLSRKPPLTRYNADGFYHANPEHHSTSNATHSYFIEEDFRHFDASFFNITPKEAEAIDPQQRLLLETVYEAMENAGLTLKGLAGSQTSHYTGLMCNDFHDLQFRDPDYLPQYIATGASRAIISNRVSYFFDWKGPSMTIDTACSSSLVAIHQAVQSLRIGESTIACASGANLLLGPEYYQAESNLHMLSPSGKSQMWDANADGYARGEAIGAIFLKTLSRALADGDHIEAIIRETGVNSDGRTKGITMPSSDAQLWLIRETYRKAGLDLLKPTERCQYFEAHGTGTPAGDPIEASAISQAFFGPDSDQNDRLFVGSIKTVVGHTEGAAGIAGVLKVVLAMQNGIVPPNQHLYNLNPSVKPFYHHLQIPTIATPWPSPPAGTPLRASVNSFGFGGTNSHIIVELYDPVIHGPGKYPELSLTTRQPAPISPLLFSTHDEKSLPATLKAYSDYLKSNQSVNLRDLAWTLQARRSALSVKIAFSGLDREDLIRQIDKQLESGADMGFRTKLLNPDLGPRILGVFTGQGSQWASMGKSLILGSKLFRDTIARLEQSLSELPEPPSWSLTEELMASGERSRLSEASLSQPLCTAIQIAAVDLLAASGVSFHAVVGHSSGEIGAAYVAGYLTATDAVRVAYYRGVFARLAQGATGKKGGMLAAGLSIRDADVFCNQQRFRNRIVVAASNAPSSVTLSGDIDAINEAKDALEAQGKFARALKVDTAYHSPHMDPCSGPYLAALAACQITPKVPDSQTVWLSSVHSDNHKPTVEELSGPYWRDNMVRPVLFSQAVEASWNEHGSFDVGLEVGPHAALKGPATQTIKEISGNSRPYHGVLDRQKDDVVAFRDALGFLWSQLGADAVDFDGYTKAMDGETKIQKPHLVKNLPKYAWDHAQIHWREGRMSKQYRQRPAFHELLGARVPGDTDYEPRWRNLLTSVEVPWLRNHRFQGQIIVPAAAYCIMALEAAKTLSKDAPVETIELQDLDLESAITLQDGHPGAEVLFSLRNAGSAKIDGQTVIYGEYSCSAGPADASAPVKRIFSGKLAIFLGEGSDLSLPPREKTDAILYPMNLDRFYSSMDNIGLNYTGSFRGLTAANRRMHMCTAKISPPTEADGSFLIHPITLDVSFQAIFAAYASPDDGSLWTSFLPRNIRRLVFNVQECQANVEARSKVNIDARITRQTIARDGQLPAISGDVHIYNDETGQLEILIEDLSIRSFSAGREAEDRQLYLEDKWVTDISSEVIVVDDWKDSLEDQALIEASERVAHFYLRGLTSEGVTTHVVPEFAKLIDFARHITTRASKAEDSTQKKWLGDTEDDIERIISQFPDQIDLNLLKAVGESLPTLISGEEPLAKKDHITHLLDRLFQDGVGFARINRQLVRTVKQVAHKHPRMNILEVGGGSGTRTKDVLEGLDDAFSSYTFTDVSSVALHQAEKFLIEFSKRTAFRILDIGKDVEEQGFSENSFDFVIASNFFYFTRSLEQTLGNIRRLLKPGGYLLITEATGDLVRFPFIMSGLPGWWEGDDENRTLARTTPLVKWDSLLRKAGLSGIDAVVYDSQDRSKHTTSLILSQATDDQIEFLRQPLQSPKVASTLSGHLLIVGGRSLESSRLIGKLLKLFGHWAGKITTVDSFEKIDPKTLHRFTAVLSLEDLDVPFIKSSTAQSFANLQAVFEHVRIILWIVRGSRADNPYHSGSVGMLRVAAAEAPRVHLQVLDIEDTDKVEEPIAESLLRLILIVSNNLRGSKSLVWTSEQELVLEHGKYLLPRVVPVRELNDRLNSLRRVIKRDIPVAETAVTIKELQSTATDRKYIAIKGQDLSGFVDSPADHRALQISHSSLFSIEAAKTIFLHLAIGSDLKTGKPYLTFIQQNSSLVSVPASWTVPLGEDWANNYSLELILTYLVAKSILEAAPALGSAILNEPDDLLAHAVSKLASAAGKRIIFTTRKARAPGTNFNIPWLHLHPKASKNMIRSRLPKDTKLLIDFAVKEQRITEGQFPSFVVQGSESILATAASASDIPPTTLLSTGLADALSQIDVVSSLVFKRSLPAIRSAELLAESDARPSLAIVDWTQDTHLPVLIQPIEASTLFSADKTYLLVGLTAELGQSLSRWIIRNGARYLAISSRNPPASSKWKDELQSMGATVAIETCDVSNKRDVVQLHERLSATLPPIGGVINGAMIMHDIPFADMTHEIFAKVLRPKVDGSKNLDEVFWNTSLDFFIMMSSTSAVIGNPGQANYASANQFMVGLAAQRKKRGVAGSVVDIGMIMGIGYIRRTDDQGTYEHFLGKQNLMPIAETDVQDIFAEAIHGGHPTTGNRSQIMTGLAKVNLSDTSKRPSWIANPRFSHHSYESERAVVQDSTGDGKQSLKEQLRNAASVAETSEILQNSFSTQLAVILQLPPDGVNKAVPLLEMGTDSLVAVEIRSWFFTEVGEDVPILILLGGASVIDLCNDIAANVFATHSSNKEGTDPSKARPAAESTPAPADTIKLSPPSTSSSDSTPSSESSSSSPERISDTSDSEPEFLSKIVLPPWERIEPMSYGQSRIWFPSTFLEDKTAYNCTTSYRLKGALNIPRFEKALLAVTQRHESFRTAFHTDSFTGEAKQDILSRSTFRLQKISLANDDKDVQREFDRLHNHVYDLEGGDTFRAVLLSHSSDYHTVIFGYHHIIIDGVSWQLSLQEFERFYSSPDASFTDASQYAKFAQKQRQLVEGGVYAKELAFWKSELANPPEPLPLFPFAKSNSRKPLTRYDTIDFVRALDAPLTEKIKKASKIVKTTTFHFYLAVFQVLLHRFLDIEDLCLGIVDANRIDREFLQTIGFMLNTLPLRLNLNGEQSFAKIVQQTRTKAYAALGRSALPIDVILDELDIERSPSLPPLFQILVNYRMGALKQKTMGNVELEWQDYKDARNPYDITISIDEKDDGTGGFVSLSLLEHLFDQAGGDLLLSTYIHLLDQFASNPELRANACSLFDNSQKENAIALGAGPTLHTDWPDTLSLRVDQITESQPEEIALRDLSGQSLKYEEMGQRINAIAAALQTLPSVRPGSHIGIYCQPSVDVVCSLLAILRIGGVYVPLDSFTPVERLALINDEAELQVVIHDDTTTGNVHSVVPSHVTVLNVSALPSRVDKIVENVSKATDNAFLMFTSGSTGKPKGVQLTNANYVAHIAAASRSMGLGKETVLQQSSVGFDLSLAQIFYGLANGGTVVVATNRGDPADLTALMLREKVTFSFCVPSEYSVMMRYGGDSLKRCSSWRIALSSGEAFPVSLKEKFRQVKLPELKVLNAYGPTEASVVATMCEVDYHNTSGEKVPIGQTLANYAVYVVDENVQPVPIGWPGEIVLGGPPISPGYLSSEQLTQEKFVADNISASTKRADGWQTLYRTGDKGRMLSDGSVIYQGRLEGDSQVKLRGVRIELDDISNTILRISKGVLFDAAVVLRGDTEQYLVAFAVFATGREPQKPESYLRSLLSTLPLPSYMKPASINPLVQLPITASGKLDRKSLNEITVIEAEEVSSDAPLSETEQCLRDIWTDLLSGTGTSVKIGKNSDFFTLGGNSLLLLRLQAEIRDKFSVNLALIDLFQMTTLDALASKIVSKDPVSSVTSLDWDSESALTPYLSSFDLRSVVSRTSNGPITVLLTGSTGFLGRAIVSQLANNSAIAKIECIAVRNTDNARRQSIDSDKIIVHPGDLGKPFLGLSEEKAIELFGRVDAIIHNGADVSFMKTYHSLRQVNVNSTKELVRLSAQHRTPFHFISTAGVAHLSGREEYEETSISEFLPPCDGSDGYVASKWASERFLEKTAEHLGLPIWIHRPTSITGDDFPSLDIVHNTLKYSRLLKAVPELKGWRGYFDFVHVDTVAQEVVSDVLSKEEGLGKPVYVHHSGEAVIPVHGIQEYLAEQVGEDVKTLSMTEWLMSARKLGMDELVATFMNMFAQGDAHSLTMPRLLKG